MFYSLYITYREKKQKEALKNTGKIVKVKVKKLYSEYVHKQGTKYYLSAESSEYSGIDFIEEFTSKEYIFLKKHLKFGSEIEIFMDYQDPKLFFIDFELIERSYAGKPEISENEQFTSDKWTYTEV